MNDLATSFTYSPLLVGLSVVVAIQAGYVGLSLALFIPGAFAIGRRLLIAGSAITLAVGIWSMHFIGMLALRTSVAIDYAVLPTLLSFLVCMLVTGVAIYLASLRSQRLLVIAALFMGLGITTMHYVGMVAVHSAFHMSHDPFYVLASVMIAIAASGLALWLAFSADRRPPLFVCALVLGCAVSGMHYTAMAGTTLHLMSSEPAATTSIISSDILAIVVSIVACSISAVFMLALVPVERSNARDDAKWKTASPSPTTSVESPALVLDDVMVAVEPAVPAVELVVADLLPIEKNGNRLHIAISEIVSVHANAHYTYIFNGRDDLFCPLSITEIELRVPKPAFFRTHRSYIVNLAFVSRTKKSGDAAIVELDTPIRRTVPVSRGRVAALRQELANDKLPPIG
jgi:NO-binding membrane sensor protein with MHYT domain